MKSSKLSLASIGILVVTFVLLALSAPSVWAQTATLSATSHAFGSVVVSASSSPATVRLTNSGTVALPITGITSNSANFTETTSCIPAGSTGGSLAAGKSCTISIIFTPTNISSFTGVITIVDSVGTQTISLTGTGAAPIRVSPTSHAFGSIAIGQTSAVQTFTVTNRGTVAMPITLSLPSLPFGASSACPGTIPSGTSDTCTISVAFTPTTTGHQTATLELGYALGTISIALQGTGIEPITVTPASRALGSVAIGQTSTAKTFTVTNQSTITQAVTITSTNAQFGETDNCSGGILAGKTCTVNATFTPVATSATGVQETGTFQIAFSAGIASVSVTGTPIAPVTVSPTSIAFSTTLAVGTPSATHTVTISNKETVTLTNLSVVASPSSYAVTGGTCTSTIAVNSSCTVNVVFTPATTGSIPGTLTISDSAVTAPQMVTMTGGGSLGNLVSVAITVPDASLPNGTTEQLKATGTYSSGKVGDVTSSTTWTTSPTGIATISSTGLATGTSQGTTTVTGAFTGTTVTGSAPLVVGAPLLTSIAVSAPTNTLTYPGTLQFAATGTYSDGTTGNVTDTVTWASSNTAAATIAAGGMATAADPTSSITTNITAALNGITSSPFGLTVVNAAPVLQTIVITGTQGSTTPATPSVANGTSVQLYATGVYSNNSTQDLTTQVSWSSAAGVTVSNTSGSQGLVAGTAVGSSSVSATLGNVTGSTTVNVTGAILKSIAISPATVASWPVGTNQQFIATGTFTDSSTQDVTQTVTWSSSSTANATIVATGSTAGLATAVAQGPVIISASAMGVPTASTPMLTVGPAALVSITITPANTSVAAGTNVTYTATGNYTDGSTQNLTSAVTWSASPDSSGSATFPANSSVATATSQGTVTITATPASGPAGTTQLTITAPVLVGITVTPTTVSIYQGGTQQFTATGTFSDNSTQNLTSTVTWGTSNGAVATVSTSGATAGLATGVGGGGPIGISATFGAIVSNSTGGDGALTVVGITSVAVTPANPTVYLGDANPSNPYGAQNNTTQFVATVNYADSTNAVVTTTANWSSSTPTVATISNTTGTQGLATVLTAGTSTVSATYAGVTGTTTLNVSAALLESIAVTPPSVSLALMGTEQFSATGTYSDGSAQDVSATVTWTSAVPTTVSISTAGLAQALAYSAGVSITASETNAAGTQIVSSAATVLVPPPTLLSITVGPPGISLAAGFTQQYTATGNYSDGSTQDLTASATWASSTTTSATITAGPNGGLASALKIGTSTISATSGIVTGSTTLTVTAPVLQSISVCLGPYPSPSCGNSTASVGVTLGLNATQQFSAMGIYSDNSTQDLTATASWTAHDPVEVNVNSTGLATVLATDNNAHAVTASYGTVAPYLNSDTGWVTASSTAPISCSTPTIDMKLLVVNNAAANYADFPAIQQILNYVGTPYDVVDVSGTAPTLSDGACHGHYQGVIFAYGGDYYNISSWQQSLINYETTFNVRQVNWYDGGDPNFGLSYTGTQIPSTQTYTTNFTPAAASVFFYANTVTPLTITNAAVDLTSADAAAGGELTPLLQDTQGNIVSAIYNYNGQQFLTQTFDSNASLMHDLIVAYGLLNWVTKGVFLGDYHVYATQSIDDFFIDDSEWIPGTTCLANPLTLDRTAPDASNLPVFRVNSGDMVQLANWQKSKQADPLLAQFELTIAMNGVGTTGNGDWSGLVAPIISSSAGSGAASFTAQDFAGLVGQSVTVTNTKNGGGALNGTWTITAITSSSATTPGTTTFTVSMPGAPTLALTAENGVADNPGTATASVADDLTANLQSYQQYFHWMSHTYDHPSTLNGLCQNTPTGTGCGDTDKPPVDDIDLEILTNRWVASDPAALPSWQLDNDSSDTVKQLTFTDFNPANIVTPGVTGLNDPNVPQYLYNDGIRYAVSDTSVATTMDPPNNNGPNPSPNVGIINSYEPGIYEVPRRPNDVFYNVANWGDDQAEFDCIYSYYVPPGSPTGTTPAPDPPFNTYNAAQVLDFTSNAFLTNMLMGDMDPEMFHQPDLHFSDNYGALTNASPSGTIPASVSNFVGSGGTHVSSLISDTYDLTFSKYEAVYKLPVLTPPMDQIAVLMQNRNSFNQSGVTASIVGAGTSGATITLTMPSTAPISSAIIPITGLASTGSEVYGGQNISHISISQGGTITFPLP